MIKGIGLDVTEIERIKKAHERTTKFHERILTSAEIQHFQSLSPKRQLEYLAGRFAAKEAFSKALGTGIGKSCSFLDIEVLANESGQPILYFHGEKVNGFISITHTEQFAAAQVILTE